MELLNQIEDQCRAIALTEQLSIGEMSEAEWREVLHRHLVDLRLQAAQTATVAIDGGDGLVDIKNIIAGDVITDSQIARHLIPEA